MKLDINKRSAILLVFTLISGLAIGFGIGKSGSGQEELPIEHDHSSHGAIWTCSMHPQIRQNKPGDCPICGMDLVEVENSNNQTSNSLKISMSPTAMKLAQVSTTRVGMENTSKLLRLNGKIQVDERRLFSQSSHIPGRIEQLSVSFKGEFVKKGQVIASIYSPDLVTAQEELFEAKKIQATQPRLFLAAKEKLKNWKLTNEQIEVILQSGSPTETFPLLADASGYVTRREVNAGDYIQKGEMIYEIADLSRVWVMLDIYESDMAWIKKGDKVSFSVASLPGKEFKSTLSYIDPVIDPKTRVASARAVVQNRDLNLKPEMFVTGAIAAKFAQQSGQLIVPKSAVMWTGKRSIVYVKSEDESDVSFELREVTLGSEVGEGYVIENGLSLGEEIAVHGTFSIDAAAQLAGKPSMMNLDSEAKIKSDNTGKDYSQHKESLNNLVDAYLSMKDALVADDFANAQSQAKKFNEQFAKIPKDLSSEITELNKYVGELQTSSNIESFRKSFQPISDAMINLVSNVTPFSESLFIQHCPMANNNKGADWLSRSKDVRNPYFGDAMLTCGEVVREVR